MENYYDEILRRFQEEQDQQNPGDLPEDFMARMPDSVRNEFATRLPDPSAPTPTVPLPEVAPEGVSEPTLDAPPPIPPSNYDVDVSTSTPRMKGIPESLPAFSPTDPTASDKPKWELEDDSQAAPSATPSAIPPSSASDLKKDTATENAALLGTGSENDNARREAELAELEKKRKLGIIPQIGAGIGDAISAGASAFGGNAPGGSMERLMARQERNQAQGKLDIEQKLRNDANSDISKQYQALVAEFLQTDPSDPTVLGLTANQIAEKLPNIEKVAKMRSDEKMKRAAIQAAKAKSAGQTTAQKAVDKAFGTDYAKYVAGGGYADTMTQIGTLESVLADLKDKSGSNLTGGGLSMLPDAIRKRTFPDSMAAQQAVESSVQRTLKQTLGGQFTEKEGILFMQRGYDPALDESQNAEKLERAVNQLKLMALAKQEAIDYYEQNDTLDGFTGTFYTLKDGKMVKADKEDFLAMMQPSADTEDSAASRKTKSGYNYSVGN